ncbi:D-alanyl-D-alanine carboxypeptidase [Fusicatenibacter saccharivorans]|nr:MULTISPECIES: D-alanyl-D-alanine carboxypeptidase family protein [Lachnospiraceae]MCB7098902.1 D-alanyl-D-alanine carboxypeptidase [Fusicatenibacter saccharivorans]MEE0694614.1 D-alanyl-D-alanine carboxypeptidase family protein [Fusicatenibacter saccharivorans]
MNRKRRNRAGFFLGILLLLFGSMPAAAARQESEPNQLFATAACLMDGDTGRVLFGKRETDPMAMASTTKIMTCILALENGGEQAVATASAQAAAAPKVHLGVYEGEQFLLGDLLYSLMLESHNDAAVMIAETIGGSIEGFAALMNEKAAAIGCTDTHFVTPNGLDASDAGGDHHTTAADLARIMRYCIKTSPKATEFLAVTQTRSYTFWDLEKKNMFNCCNHNALLDQMEGAISGKTGFTAKAGYCYTGALERDGKCLIVTLLACGWPNHKNYKWADAAKLLNYGLESYTYRDVLDHSWKPGRIEVTDGVYDGLLQTKSSASLTLVSPALDPARSLPVLLKETEIPKKDIFLPELIEAPVKKGEKVGSMTYSIDGILLAEYPVYAAETIEKIDYGWCMEQVAERLFCHASV